MKRESLSGKVSKNKIIMAVVIAVLLYAIYYYWFGQNHTLNAQQSIALLNSRFNVTNVTVYNGNRIRTYHAYLAASPAQQAEGYMNVSTIGNCDGMGGCIGMVFAFDQYGTQCFWMENTALRLKQTWLDYNGYPAYSYNATPFSKAVLCHAGTYVVETLQNFTINGTAAIS